MTILTKKKRCIAVSPRYRIGAEISEAHDGFHRSEKVAESPTPQSLKLLDQTMSLVVNDQCMLFVIEGVAELYLVILKCSKSAI